MLTDGFDPITTSMTGEEYMAVLIERQSTWMQGQSRPHLRFPPLLEWFILPGEENLVQLPEAAPKSPSRPPGKPRVHRSAASLREERDALLRRMDQAAGVGVVPDRAAANLSPNARSRSARVAGRRRFAQMDRALEECTRLRKRVERLNGRVALAEDRERRSAQRDDTTTKGQ